MQIMYYAFITEGVAVLTFSDSVESRIHNLRSVILCKNRIHNGNGSMFVRPNSLGDETKALFANEKQRSDDACSADGYFGSEGRGGATDACEV